MAYDAFGLETQPEFPMSVTFTDVDADVLAREAAIQRQSRAALISGSAWGEFMRKVLSPAAQQPTLRLLRASQA
jgi:hypothetical protein